MKSEPALVYTTDSTRDEINKYLTSQRLYRYDDVQEGASDINRPSVERPILRRNMLFAAIGGALTPGTADDVVVAPGVFVTDHLATLGPDRISQVAVVGALMNFGLRVHADYREIDGNWYVGQVPALGFIQLDLMMQSLLRMNVEDAGEFGILSTTWTRGWSEAGRRAQELVDQQGMSFTQAAPILAVEGYHNRKARVRWYPKAARHAYEAAR